MEISDIPVLFVREKSIYKKIGLDCYDIKRNALNYDKALPVIAHPPCRGWGKLSHMSKADEQEKNLARWAISLIRKNGGVLEHPESSKLWHDQALPFGLNYDSYGGFTLCVNQSWFGHVAPKKTWLYIVGITMSQVPDYSPNFQYCTHRVTTDKKMRIKKKKGFPIKECSRKLSEYTPEPFARFLMEIIVKINQRKNHEQQF